MCVCVRVCVGLCVCARACVLKMCTAGMCGRDECLCVHVCLLFNSLNQEFMITPSTGFGAQCHATARSSCQVNSARAKAHVGANHSEPVCVCVCVRARVQTRPGQGTCRRKPCVTKSLGAHDRPSTADVPNCVHFCFYVVGTHVHTHAHTRIHVSSPLTPVASRGGYAGPPLPCRPP